MPSLAKFGSELLAALEIRSATEPLWWTLRRIFDPTLESTSGDEFNGEHAAEMQRVIESTAALRGGYLYRFDQIQISVVGRLPDRRPDVDVLRLRTVVSAAFACFSAASRTVAETQGEGLASMLDRGMAFVEPQSGDVRGG